MALKDWKKIGKYIWRNKYKNSIIEIETRNEPEFTYKYLVYLHGAKWNGDGFKTKSQALKFAKSYMRKH